MQSRPQAQSLLVSVKLLTIPKTLCSHRYVFIVQVTVPSLHERNNAAVVRVHHASLQAANASLIRGG